MATIVTRASKGSALTWTEGDANITNLNNDKIEAVADDLTPQLSGNLDVNDNEITTTATNGSIVLRANGTGVIEAISDGFVVGTGTSGAVITSNGANNLILDTNDGTNSGNITITAGVNGDISITPNGTGKVVTTKQLDANILRATQSAGDEGGELQLALAATNTTLSGSVAIDINQNRLRIFETGGSNRGAYIDLSSAATGVGTDLLAGGGATTLNGLTDVTIASVADGQILVYNGTSSQWENTTVAGGLDNVVEDTTPQLGGNLDVNGQKIVSTANGNIELEPNGTGDVVLAADTVRIGDLNQPATLTSSGNANLILNTNSGNSSGNITITSNVNGNISITPNGTGQTVVTNLEYNENIFSLGTTSGTIAPNVANGNVQTITLAGNLTLNAFTSPVAGQSLTLIVNTGGTGRTLTSTMKFAGGSKTLSATNTTDIITVFYDGTNYWASLATDFK